MKHLTNYVRESLYDAQLSVIANGFLNQLLFPTIDAARRAVKGMDGVTYYDITIGANSGEEENLVEWFGKGGYWYNICYEPSFKQTRREIAMAERAKNKEIKIL